MPDTSVATATAIDLLNREWLRLRRYAEQGEIPLFVVSCQTLLSVLRNPNLLLQASWAQEHDFVAGATATERFWLSRYLDRPGYRLFTLEQLRISLEALQHIVGNKGDTPLLAEVTHAYRGTMRLRKTLVLSGALDKQKIEYICRRASKVPLRFAERQKAQDTVKSGVDLLTFLNRRNGNNCWTQTFRANLPADSRLIVQMARPGSVRSLVWGHESLQSIDHRADFTELSQRVADLDRKMDHGSSPAQTSLQWRWFKKNLFDEWPLYPGTLYYVGTGIFSRLPLSLFVDRPFVWLNQRPQFTIHPVSPLVRGTALWSNRAPEPLHYTEHECRQLPNFLCKPATKASLRAALMHHEPVHLATHAEALNDGRSETRIFLEDGEMSVTDLARIRMEAPIVYLSACQTSVRSLMIEGPTSLADTLLRAGVGAVVATKWRIPDDQAMVVAHAFWRKVRQGLSPPQALYEARQALHTSHAHAFELHY